MARKMLKGIARRKSFSPHARGWPAWPVRPDEPLDRSPRTRGDGPNLRTGEVITGAVLPARAGMARSLTY